MTETPNAVISWTDKLAGMADETLDEIGAAVGQFFSTRGGMLKFGGAALPGNEMAVIIMDSIHENAYFTGSFDPDNPTPPDCFSFSRTGKNMAPHEIAGKPQCSDCENCEWNAWGSADKGKGKACKNIRRLGLLSIGSFNKAGDFIMVDEPKDIIGAAEVGFLKVPVTSVKNFANYAKTIATAGRRPPFAVITKITVVPGEPAFKILFEKVCDVPDELMDAVMERRNEVVSTIDFPYQPLDEKEDESPIEGATKKKSKY